MKVKGKRGWQVVRTFAGFHARFTARNSECIAWTEVYPEERTAIHALRVIAPDATFTVVDERRLKVTPRPGLPEVGAS